jgi:hypothetical protein
MIQKTNAAYEELHTYTSRQKNFQSFVSNDQGDCCCTPPLDATSFENGYPTTEELVCPAVSEESVTAVQRAFRTQRNHTAEYPFTPGTRNSNRKGAFASITRDTLACPWHKPLLQQVLISLKGKYQSVHPYKMFRISSWLMFFQRFLVDFRS